VRSEAEFGSVQSVGVRVARQGLLVNVAGFGWWDAERRRSWCSTAAWCGVRL